MALRIEVLKITPKRLPRTRLEELERQIAPSGQLEGKVSSAALWTYRSVEMYLRPEHSMHTWEHKQCDYQLLLWDDDKIVAELYGIFYPNRAVIGGIHSDVPGGGTRLMRSFAKLAAHRPIRLNAIEPAVGFYRKLGLRLAPDATNNHHSMVWPRAAQDAAASLA